ncbi:site-2 protease family protein [Candidatus Babeliales bacterium]|nr:site-2 protease family protein [Candidatus Babeliales bacterium]
MNLNVLSIFFTTKFVPLIFTIIGFGLLITIHEFGHFIFCKIFGVYTPTFSLGMGPKILEKKIGTTNFRLSAIPLGGYVEIAGLAEVGGQGEQEHSKLTGGQSFESKPYWQKAIILLGGVLFNLLFAYIFFSIIYFYGVPKQKADLIINTKIEKTIQKKFNIAPEDKIISIDNQNLSSDPKKLIPVLQKYFLKKFTGADIIPLTVLRNNKNIKLNLNFKSEKEQDEFLGSLQLKTTPIEGQYEKHSLFGAIGKGIQVTNGWIFNIIYGIKCLITERTLKGVGGPVMILSKTFETAQKGFLPLLIFLCIISINLAVLNILPIGALDGGQFLFVSVEAIIRRPIPETIKLVINIGSWILILGLVLYLSYKDLMAIIWK